MKKDKTEVLPEVYKSYPQLEKYDVAGLAIAKMEQEYLPLKIAGIKDLEGYDKVKEALSVVRSKRIDVEKKRKELKADSLEYGRVVDSEAKRIRELLEPIESHLDSEKSKVDQELERIRTEKARLEQERINKRITTLLEIGMLYNPATKEYYYQERKVHEDNLGVFSDENFDRAVDDLSKTIEQDRLIEAEKERKQAEEKERIRVEIERLEKLKLEQEKKEIEFQIKRTKLDEDQKKIWDEKDKIKREAEIEKIKVDAKVKAQKEARENVLREAEEKRKQEELDRLEEQRQKELAPDKVKLEKFIQDVMSVETPVLKSKKAQLILATAVDNISEVEQFIKSKIKTL